MFIIIEYLDEWNLLGEKYLTEEISIFSVISIRPGKNGGCKVKISGFSSDFNLKETAESFKARCNDALQSIQPVQINAPVQIENIFEPPADPQTDPIPKPKPTFEPLVFEMERKELDDKGAAMM